MMFQVSLFLALLSAPHAAAAPGKKAAAVAPVNVLMVGFDGSRRERVDEMLKAGRLPNLKKLIERGSYVRVNIKVNRTDTKAGWSEILTGYDWTVNKVRANKWYSAIPKGLTLFERLKEKFGPGFQTVLLTGKTNNLGVRGPHKICMNCITRLEGNFAKSKWWDESTTAPTFNDEPRKLEPRDGEPYYNAHKTSIDFYKNQLLAAPNVVREAKKVLPKLKGKSFFAFVHFEEPDEQGHQFGENSKEYTKALETADENLGALLEEVKKNGLDKNLRLFVMGDHGFDVMGSGKKDDREHGTDAARSTFLVSDQPGLREEGDRRDFAPTVLQLFGIAPASVQPKLQGAAYF